MRSLNRRRLVLKIWWINPKKIKRIKFLDMAWCDQREECDFRGIYAKSRYWDSQEVRNVNIENKRIFIGLCNVSRGHRLTMIGFSRRPCTFHGSRLNTYVSSRCSTMIIMRISMIKYVIAKKQSKNDISPRISTFQTMYSNFQTQNSSFSP